MIGRGGIVTSRTHTAVAGSVLAYPSEGVMEDDVEILTLTQGKKVENEGTSPNKPLLSNADQYLRLVRGSSYPSPS